MIDIDRIKGKECERDGQKERDNEKERRSWWRKVEKKTKFQI